MFNIYLPFFKFLGFIVLIIIGGYFCLMLFLILIVKTKNKKRVEKILLMPKRLPLWINFLRWILVDTMRGKKYPIWGIYIFVAKPGNGKTISMTEHVERVRKVEPDIKVYSNFNFKGQSGSLTCWQDIVDAPDNCILMIDELHMLASSGAWKNFPLELLGEITQNRHSRKQFITSTQDYDLINVNFKRVCNYVVLCKNIWGLDRLFSNHYFDRGVYESKSFLATIKKSNFARYFVASDDTYARYDTLEKINCMVKQIEYEDDKGVLVKLKELLEMKELLPTEVKYVAKIINRFESDLQSNADVMEKDNLIKELQEKLLKYEVVLS